jgi:hypothetical protein
VRLFITTIAPFEGASPDGFHSAEKEALRGRINDWLRASRDFDAIVDIDAVLRDPARPTRLLPAYDSGDHLHVNAEGNRAAAALLQLQSSPGTRAGIVGEVPHMPLSRAACIAGPSPNYHKPAPAGGSRRIYFRG